MVALQVQTWWCNISPENQSVSTTISPGTTSTITLGVVQGVTITIDNQQIDTSGLTSLTGTITLIIIMKNEKKIFNALTLLRIALIPILFILRSLYLECMSLHDYFAVASITDYLDYLLVNEVVTNFGNLLIRS